MAIVTVDGPGGERSVVVADPLLTAELVKKFDAVVSDEDAVAAQAKPPRRRSAVSKPTGVATAPSDMTVRELRDHAAAEGIDIAGASLKADILAVIEAASGASPDGHAADVADVAGPVVTGVEVTPGPESVTVTWDAAVDTGSVTGFEVESADLGDSPVVEVDEAAGSPFDVVDLLDGVTYLFRVRAVTETGPGPWSDPVEATPVRDA